MKSQTLVRYNLDEIDSHKSKINLIWGERSNGKSYQVKHKKAIEYYLATHRRFILMRRWKEEVKGYLIEQYFQDVDIVKLTDGKYNYISVYRNKIYLSNYNTETAKLTRGEYIGYVVALSTEQNYAGGSYLDVDNILFEEFMSRSGYLKDEPDKLMNFYNTIDRKRNIVRLWLVGNTITRVCPYLEEWDLQGIVKNQEQGTIIDKYLGTNTFDEITKEEIMVKLSIEYCKNTGNTSYAVGKNRDMINKGSWQTSPQPHLPKSRKDYTRLFAIYFEYQSFKFCSEFIKDIEEGHCCWFIYPYSKEIPNNVLVFSDKIKTSLYYQKDIYNLTRIKNKRLRDLLQTFKLNNIFFSDDLTGTDFKQVIDFEIRK